MPSSIRELPTTASRQRPAEGNRLKQMIKRPKALVGALGVGLFVFAAIGAPWVAPHDPMRLHPLPNVTKPAAPGGEFLLGTDSLGRDVLSRVLWGARYSLAIGLVSVAIGLVLGSILGLASGYAGGRVDLVLMRVVDLLMAFPGILLAIFLMAVLGPSLGNLMLAVGIVNTPVFARQARAGVMSLKGREFVLASRAVGAGPVGIVLGGILPNIASQLLVLATLAVGTSILEAAGLGFVGLGVEPGTPEWGLMLAEERQYFRTCPWVVLAPGTAVSFAVLSANLLGEALREALDPKDLATYRALS